MSLGFEQAGFDVRAAVDVEPVHLATYARNFPQTEVIPADLGRISGTELRKRSGLPDSDIDCVFGGPPCQGFSVGGRRENGDPRNELLGHFARLVCELSPRYFVAENVAGLMMGEARRELDNFITQVERSGFSVISSVGPIDAADYGVPQRRRRVFIIGWRVGGTPVDYPPPSGTGTSVSVWDAIGDLPDPDEVGELASSDVYLGDLGHPSLYSAELRKPSGNGRGRRDGLSGCARTAHTTRTRRRFAETVPGEYEPTSRFYRLTKEGVAPTLRAGTGPDRGSYTAPRPIHPVQNRCITVREAARLHSFPDWFDFDSTKWHGMRQVGNSVPPLLAQAVALQFADETGD